MTGTRSGSSSLMALMNLVTRSLYSFSALGVENFTSGESQRLNLSSRFC